LNVRLRDAVADGNPDAVAALRHPDAAFRASRCAS